MCKKRGRNYVQYRKKGTLHGEKENYLYRERKEIILCTLSERKYVRREKGNMYRNRGGNVHRLWRLRFQFDL